MSDTGRPRAAKRSSSCGAVCLKFARDLSSANGREAGRRTLSMSEMGQRRKRPGSENDVSAARPFDPCGYLGVYSSTRPASLLWIMKRRCG